MVFSGSFSKIWALLVKFPGLNRGDLANKLTLLSEGITFGKAFLSADKGRGDITLFVVV